MRPGVRLAVPADIRFRSCSLFPMIDGWTTSTRKSGRYFSKVSDGLGRLDTIYPPPQEGEAVAQHANVLEIGEKSRSECVSAGSVAYLECGARGHRFFRPLFSYNQSTALATNI